MVTLLHAPACPGSIPNLPRAGRMVTADVLVVGAGVAGLRCALALADAGLKVVVLEAAPHPGGRAASWADETTGVQVDTGPHAISSEHRNFIAMLQRLGTADQVLWQPS